MGNLVSAKELAERLGISLRMLEELIVQERVPRYIKLGRLRKWHPDQVDRWIEEQFSSAEKEGATQPPAMELTSGKPTSERLCA